MVQRMPMATPLPIVLNGMRMVFFILRHLNSIGSSDLDVGEFGQYE